jgi:hypothetical protein
LVRSQALMQAQAQAHAQALAQQQVRLNTPMGAFSMMRSLSRRMPRLPGFGGSFRVEQERRPKRKLGRPPGSKDKGPRKCRKCDKESCPRAKHWGRDCDG